MLRPDVVLRISEQLAPITDPYLQTCKAAELALQEIRTAHAAGEVALPEREVPWLDLLDQAVQEMPGTEDQMIERMLPLVSPDTCNLGEYGIDAQ